MEILIGLLIVAVIIYLGYNYTKGRQADDFSLHDDDFTHCQTRADKKYSKGSTEYNADVAACYIDKKTHKVKKLLNQAD